MSMTTERTANQAIRGPKGGFIMETAIAEGRVPALQPQLNYAAKIAQQRRLENGKRPSGTPFSGGEEAARLDETTTALGQQLPGLNQTNRQLMAFFARYHEKQAPSTDTPATYTPRQLLSEAEAIIRALTPQREGFGKETTYTNVQVTDLVNLAQATIIRPGDTVPRAWTYRSDAENAEGIAASLVQAVKNAKHAATEHEVLDKAITATVRQTVSADTAQAAEARANEAQPVAASAQTGIVELGNGMVRVRGVEMKLEDVPFGTRFSDQPAQPNPDQRPFPGTTNYPTARERALRLTPKELAAVIANPNAEEVLRIEAFSVARELKDAQAGIIAALDTRATLGLAQTETGAKIETAGVHFVENITALALDLIAGKGITHEATLAHPTADGVAFFRVNAHGLQIDSRKDGETHLSDATLEGVTALFIPEGRPVSFVDVQRVLHLVNNMVRIREQAGSPLLSGEQARVGEMQQAVQILSTALSTTKETGNNTESMVRALDSFSVISASLGREALVHLAASLSIHHTYIPLEQLSNVELISMIDHAIDTTRAFFEPQSALSLNATDRKHADEAGASLAYAEGQQAQQDFFATIAARIQQLQAPQQAVIETAAPEEAVRRTLIAPMGTRNGPDWTLGVGNMEGYRTDGLVNADGASPDSYDRLAIANAPIKSTTLATLNRLAQQTYNATRGITRIVHFDIMSGKPVMEGEGKAKTEVTSPVRTAEFDTFKELKAHAAKSASGASDATHRVMALEAMVEGTTIGKADQRFLALANLFAESGSGVLRDIARVLQVNVPEIDLTGATTVEETTPRLAAHREKLQRVLYTALLTARKELFVQETETPAANQTSFWYEAHQRQLAYERTHPRRGATGTPRFGANSTWAVERQILRGVRQPGDTGRSSEE